MLSMPVWGVEMRKAAVAPRLAPELRMAAATGTTPQEHSGSGTPSRTAFSTGSSPLPPR